MNEPLPESKSKSSLSPRQMLFLLLSGCLGATAGYEVGLQVGVAMAPREGAFLAPRYSLWPAALIGALLGIAVFVPLMWALRVDPAEHAPSVPHPNVDVPKAPSGTYVLAMLRGAFLGCLLCAAVAVVGVVLVIGPNDKWFWMFVLVYAQLGAAIGVVVGGIVEPLRIRHVRRKLFRHAASAHSEP